MATSSWATSLLKQLRHDPAIGLAGFFAYGLLTCVSLRLTSLFLFPDGDHLLSGSALADLIAAGCVLLSLFLAWRCAAALMYFFRLFWT